MAEAVAEDLALAERYAAAGLALRCLGGGQRIRFRMYRDLRGIVEGWSKNLATGAGRTPVVRALGIGWWVWSLLVLALWSWPVGSFTVGGFTAADGVAVAASYAAGAVQTALLGRRVGAFGIAALAWPVLFAFFVAVFVVSAARTVLFRRVRWSGRTVRLASRR